MIDQNYDPQPPAKPLMARRRLLKILGAGMLTPLALPEQWLTPKIKVGHLPAHAQTSGLVGIVTISNLARSLVSLTPTCTRGSNTGNDYQVSFDYVSSLGGVEAGAIVTQSSVYDNGISASFTKTLTAADISGTALAGSVSYTFCAAFGSATSVTTPIVLQTTTGSSSNVLSVVMTKPSGALEHNTSTETWEIAP